MHWTSTWQYVLPQYRWFLPANDLHRIPVTTNFECLKEDPDCNGRVLPPRHHSEAWYIFSPTTSITHLQNARVFCSSQLYDHALVHGIDCAACRRRGRVIYTGCSHVDRGLAFELTLLPFPLSLPLVHKKRFELEIIVYISQPVCITH